MKRLTIACAQHGKFRVVMNSKLSGEHTVIYFHRDEVEQARDAFTAALDADAVLARMLAARPTGDKE